MFRLDLEKAEETKDQIANIHWIIEKAREFQKNICFIDYAKGFDCVDNNQLWKILKEMGIPDHLTCLLSNLYGGQETTVRTACSALSCNCGILAREDKHTSFYSAILRVHLNSTIIWSQVKQQGGNTAPSINIKLD